MELLWKDVDFDLQNYTKRDTKSCKTLTQPMNEKVREVLLLQRLERQQDILLGEYVRLIEEAREAGDYKSSLKALNNLFDRLKLSERILAQPLLETLESNPDDLYEVLNQAIQLMAKAGRHTDLVKLLELRVKLQLGDKGINSETVIETVF